MSRLYGRPLHRITPVRSCVFRPRRAFHAGIVAKVQIHDRLPDIDLMESSPGNKVSLSKEFSDGGRGVIIGIPAAFSPSCSATHVPGYIHSSRLASAGKVFVVSVNDAFVMKAFGTSLDPDARSGIRFLADPHAAFTNALGLAFDATAIFGQPRSKRYALVIQDGKVQQLFVEPDNTGVKVSRAEEVLGQ